jgi:uncharacterized protein with von Willebrand factor type A (vWA) domain
MNIDFKEFEIWLDKQEVAPYKSMFHSIPFSAKRSYIIDFLDEIGLIVEIHYERNTKQFFGSILNVNNNNRVDVSNNIKTRNKFYKQVFEKIFSIEI